MTERSSAWTMTKTASVATYSSANTVITYTYRITKTESGLDSGLRNVRIDDNRVGTVCSGRQLIDDNAGGTIVCTYVYTTTVDDLLLPSITNIATATGCISSDCGPLPPITAQATVTNTAQPGWNLTKTPAPTTYTGAGQGVSYSYVLTNTGQVVISAISLTDNKVAPLNCPATTLAAGASMTCTGNYTTTAADVTATFVTNTATATGTPAAGVLAPATAQATINLIGQPSWTLAKTPTPTTYTGAGQPISYSYVLTNIGNVSISAISLTDNKVAPVNCPATALAAGASMTCSGSYTTTAADVTATFVTNTATATGTPALGALAPATAQATITFNTPLPAPAWTLAKTANPTTYSAAGQSIAYTYVLTNTGNASISAIALTDNKVAAVNCPATTLAVGANMTCAGTYVTTAADAAASSVTNIATATGTPAFGTLGPATAQATIQKVAASGSITIVKVTNGGDGTFSFSSTVAGSTSFTLATAGGAATRSFTGLAAGAYTFTTS